MGRRAGSQAGIPGALSVTRLLALAAGLTLGAAAGWYWTWTRHEDTQEDR